MPYSAFFDVPIYLYKNPKSGEIVEILQDMNSTHEYSDRNGLKHERVFTTPNASIDTSIDAFNAKDFARKTSSKKGSLGDLWDISREASAKREKSIGKDPVKDKYLSDYSAARRGKKLPKDFQR